MTKHLHGRNRQDDGFSLLEVMIAAAILAIVSSSVVLTSLTLSRSAGIILRKTISAQLAATKLEELSAIDPSRLNDSFDTLEIGIVVEGNEFTRQVDITVNPDRSRSVRIDVRPASSLHDESVTLRQTFSLWGLT